MKYKELINDWDPERLFKFNIDKTKENLLNKTTNDFLSNIGLPKSAAPFLSFASNEDERKLLSINEVYETDEDYFDTYLCLGSDGSGNVICIDLKQNCQIYLLDHEDDFSPTYVNASVVELFQFLTFYKRFINVIKMENGSDAYLESNFSDEHLADLKTAMDSVEPKALTRSSFWQQELNALGSGR